MCHFYSWNLYDFLTINKGNASERNGNASNEWWTRVKMEPNVDFEELKKERNENLFGSTTFGVG